MPPFQVTESTCSTKSLLDYFMFSDGGLGVGNGRVMHRNASRGTVPSTQRKNLSCWGICRDGYEGGCLEMDTFVVKALPLWGIGGGEE